MSRPRRLKVIVEADGGSRGNPGVAGYGTVIREASTGEVLLERAEAIGVATNNIAEYRGLIAGLQAAADLGAVEVEARLDSKLVIEQMSGRWQIKHPGLRPLAAQAATLVRRFDAVRFTWIPRERNKRADELANAAMDGTTPAEPDLSPQPPMPWMPPATTGATRLILVRHAQTAHTVEHRFSGRADVALTPRGLVQVEAAAARLADVDRVAAVVTSPLSRCRRMAEAIAEALTLPDIRVEDDLVECDFGDWDSLTLAEVRERWPVQLDEWHASASVAPPGGESLDAVRSRARGVVSRLLADYPDQSVIVVSHVTTIKLMLRDALAASDALLHRLFLDPAGISIVDSWPTGQVAVRCVNDTAHLTRNG